MARLWIEFYNSPTKEFETVSHMRAYLTSEVKLIGAEGEDLPFEDLIALGQKECIFIGVRLNSINFKNVDVRTDRKTWTFVNCYLDNVVFDSVLFNKLDFDNCTINYFKVENSQFVYGLYFKNKTCIENELNILDLRPYSSNITLSFTQTQIKRAFIVNSSFTHFETESLESGRFELNDCKALREIKIKDCTNVGFHFYGSKSFQKFQVDNVHKSNILIDFCELETAFFELTNSSTEFMFRSLFSKEKLRFDLSNSCESYFLFIDGYATEEVVFEGNCFKNKRNLEINNSVFKELVRFNGNNGKSLVITNTLFQKGIFLPISTYKIYSWWKFKKNKDLNNQIKLIHSSVWCTLKNQSLARNDNISALEFKRYEMNSYSKELNNTEGRSQEKFVLWLNNWSNKHGLIWGRGLAFTVIVWLFFFAFFYTLSHRGFDFPKVQIDLCKSKFWVDAFKFLWIPNGIDLLTDTIKFNYNFFYSLIIAFFFIFGKIFIGYGIFQTISAFRKHGQK